MYCIAQPWQVGQRASSSAGSTSIGRLDLSRNGPGNPIICLRLMRALETGQRLFLSFFPKKGDDVIFKEHPRPADLGARKLACTGELHHRISVHF
ncbi:hypothetical protein bAD24_I16620 [Burkholderia sp. AD24]|nr:hypothetical protein bAD24_I16620 [Burkholderia sp. AD24]